MKNVDRQWGVNYRERRRNRRVDDHREEKEEEEYEEEQEGGGGSQYLEGKGVAGRRRVSLERNQ